jgi:transcriptional regulator with XRE-family HTH domain
MYLNFLKAIRINKLKLSQQELADKLHLSQSAYSRYENGSQDLPANILIKMKEEFNIDPQEILPLPHQQITCENGSTNVNVAINTGVIYAIPKELLDKILERLDDNTDKKK